jgi:hypothetical protein
LGIEESKEEDMLVYLSQRFHGFKFFKKGVKSCNVTLKSLFQLAIDQVFEKDFSLMPQLPEIMQQQVLEYSLKRTELTLMDLKSAGFTLVYTGPRSAPFSDKSKSLNVEDKMSKLFSINGTFMYDSAQASNNLQTEEDKVRCKRLLGFLKENYNAKMRSLPRYTAKFNQNSESGASNFCLKTLPILLSDISSKLGIRSEIDNYVHHRIAESAQIIKDEAVKETINSIQEEYDRYSVDVFKGSKISSTAYSKIIGLVSLEEKDAKEYKRREYPEWMSDPTLIASINRYWKDRDFRYLDTWSDVLNVLDHPLKDRISALTNGTSHLKSLHNASSLG